MAVIDYTDVETAIGRPISDGTEQDQITQWIDDVEMLIGSRLDAWGLEDLDDLDQPLLKYVVREAVIARIRYREDRNSQRGNATEDDTDSGEEHYFLRILNPWWALLSPTRSAPAAAVFSFSLLPSGYGASASGFDVETS